MLWNICESVNVILFSFGRTLSSFSLRPHSSLTLSNAFGCICRVSQMAEMSPFSKSANFFSNSICVWFKFTSTLLFLFLPDTFLWSNSLLIIYFYKMSHGFITGRQESMWLMPHCLCMNWITHVQWPIINRPWKKEVTWFVTEQKCASVVYVVIFKLKREQQVHTLCNYSQLIYCGNWNVSYVIRNNIV